MSKDITRRWKQEASRFFFSNSEQNRTNLELVRRYEGGHFILIKETIHEKEMTSLNICTGRKCCQLDKRHTTGYKVID